MGFLCDPFLLWVFLMVWFFEEKKETKRAVQTASLEAGVAAQPRQRKELRGSPLWDRYIVM